MNGVEVFVPIAFFATVIAIVLGVPLVRARIRRMDRQELPAGDPRAEERMARIEAAVEAIAIEVERISEGQRFTTKLLSERPATPAAIPKPTEVAP